MKIRSRFKSFSAARYFPFMAQLKLNSWRLAPMFDWITGPTIEFLQWTYAEVAPFYWFTIVISFTFYRLSVSLFIESTTSKTSTSCLRFLAHILLILYLLSKTEHRRENPNSESERHNKLRQSFWRLLSITCIAKNISILSCKYCHIGIRMRLVAF